MNKSTQNFYIDLGLFLLLVLTVVTATVEIFFPCFVHVFLGLSLSFGALLHLVLHWGWVKAAISHFGRLPTKVQTNFLLNLALFFAYGAAAGVGLIARSMFFLGPLRHVIGFFHVSLVVGLMSLQAVHLALHWSWIASNAKKVLSISLERKNVR